MSSTLSARLKKLEDAVPVPRGPQRVLRIVSGEGRDDEARELIEAEGFDPMADDIVIHRVIVAPPGKPPASFPPRILSRSPDHVR